MVSFLLLTPNIVGIVLVDNLEFTEMLVSMNAVDVLVTRSETYSQLYPQRRELCAAIVVWFGDVN